MNLELQRQPTADEATLGTLLIDGLYFCQTMEDAVREVPQNEGESDADWVKRWKQFGRTAIPARCYEVVLAASLHFGNRLMPHLKGVPGYDAIMIHPLNTVLQTEGCIGVGMESVDAAHSPFRQDGKAIPGLLKSLIAFDPLLLKIKDCWAHDEQVLITIKNPV